MCDKLYTAQHNIFYIKIIQDITLGNILLWIWILISILLFCYLILQYQRLNRIIRIVPEDKDMKIDMMLSELCSQKKIKKKQERNEAYANRALETIQNFVNI